ncbi:hypothetical protein N5I19_20555 [Pseudomonas chengduensis]|nr:alpha/beta fold hydrolase [Pseudomonas chengduensis]MDH1561350.1 hypothetical protein [Pseudomonas chengduensis]
MGLRSHKADNKKLILFIHGLSGSANGTWDTMLGVVNDCEALRNYEIARYEYPTRLFRLPFGKKMPSIQELAEGLRSFIEAKYASKTDILLVGHSLGGLVARRYIAEAVKSKREHSVKGLLLYASPLNGSGLANIGSNFSWRHAHLTQLSVKSDFLTSLNNDWVILKVENEVKVLSLIAGVDAVVSRDSAAPYIGAENTRTLILYGHSNIVEPANQSDERFIWLQRFAEDVFSPPLSTVLEDEGDVLFDSYTSQVEKHYLLRTNDEIVQEAAKGSNLWVSGPPGVGKTAALRRLSDINNWRFNHIILDAYIGLNAASLMREVCNILNERCGIEQALPPNISNAELMAKFRKAIGLLVSEKPLAILIEEIPLDESNGLKEFLSLVYQLTLLTEEASKGGRVIWLFTSLKDPASNIDATKYKLHEKVQLVIFEKWKHEDAISLIEIINGTLGMNLSAREIELIARRSSGCPRFIKMTFRRMRNEVGSQKTLDEIFSSVSKDLSYD